jgi:hypothetical protein
MQVASHHHHNHVFPWQKLKWTLTPQTNKGSTVQAAVGHNSHQNQQHRGTITPMRAPKPLRSVSTSVCAHYSLHAGALHSLYAWQALAFVAAA